MAMDPCAVNGDQTVSDALANNYADKLRSLSDNLLHGTMSLDDWHATMQDVIRLSYLHQAVAGAPDADARLITPADRARIEADIATQYQYLDKFTSDIESAVVQPGASLDFIPARAEMYAQSSGAEYWRQAVNVDLPAMPRDGSTQCLSNCQCQWDLTCNEDGTVTASWQLGAADHCPDCVVRASEWSALVIQP